MTSTTRSAVLRLGFAAVAALALGALASGLPALAQPSPPPGDGPPPQAPQAPRGPMRIEPDPRVEQRTYRFEDTSEDLAYTVYVSSKVDPAVPAPLVVALHGLGGDSNFIVRDRLVDLAEEGGYVVVGPLGYNVGGWYGSPVLVRNGQPIEPPNLAELSEKDVLNVFAMARAEWNIDPDRTYLMGHSMGGAGTLFLGQKYAGDWAALAAIAPAAFAMQPAQDEILAPIEDAGLPVMIVQGDADELVPAENTRTWVEAMERLGLEHEYVELAGGDHGSVIGDGMPDIFRFFAEHARGR